MRTMSVYQSNFEFTKPKRKEGRGRKKKEKKIVLLLLLLLLPNPHYCTVPYQQPAAETHKNSKKQR